VDRISLESDEGLARLAHLHRFAQVGQCVNGVTHDINNLLGAAMAYAELAALDPNLSPETTRMMGQIVDGASKCSLLIRSLTGIARRDRVDVNLISLDQVLKEILQLRDYELKIAQITLDLHVDEQIPALTVDLPKLKVALLYLLMNAEEALRGKEDRRLRVAAGTTEDGAFVEIWDSGGGIPPERVAEAFEPLTTFWPDSHHMGMGLYTARSVAEMHDGALTYSPESGFRMTLLRRNRLSDLM